MMITTNYLQKEFSEDVGLEWHDNIEADMLILLEKVIQVYLEKHFEKLLSIMYRIDVDERSFSEALTTEKPAFYIARLVLEREKKRIEIREKYKNKDKN